MNGWLDEMVNADREREKNVFSCVNRQRDIIFIRNHKEVSAVGDLDIKVTEIDSTIFLWLAANMSAPKRYGVSV